MPANKFALLRYRIIDRCLRNSASPYPGKEKLREACEESLYGSGSERISGSTIEKDLWAMRYESELGYYAPIEYHPGHRGYYYSDNNYSISQISLNDDDLAAIRFAAATLEQFRDVPLLSGYENAIQKVIDRLSIAPIDHGRLTNIVLFEKEHNPIGSQFLAPLISAIEGHQRIKILYKKFGSSELSTYELEPLLLKEYRNMWYLIAGNVEKDKIATFGLDRIGRLSILDVCFESPAGFNVENYFAHAVGISVGNEMPVKLKLKLAARWHDYILAHPIHIGQNVSDVDSGVFFVDMEVEVSSELFGILMGFAEDLEVISPDSVRKRIKEILQQTMRPYA